MKRFMTPEAQIIRFDSVDMLLASNEIGFEPEGINEEEEYALSQLFHG